MDTNFYNPEPVVVPAQEEKVYNRLWMTRCIIESPEINKGTVVAEFYPYNGSDIDKSATPIQKSVPNFWELVNTNQTVGQAYAMFIVAIKEATGL